MPYSFIKSFRNRAEENIFADHLTHAGQQAKNEKQNKIWKIILCVICMVLLIALECCFVCVPTNVRQCVRVDLHPVSVLLFYGTCDAVELGNPPRQLPNDTDNIVLPHDCRSIATVPQM